MTETSVERVMYMGLIASSLAKNPVCEILQKGSDVAKKSGIQLNAGGKANQVHTSSSMLGVRYADRP